jgi:hypothetical protein
MGEEVSIYSYCRKEVEAFTLLLTVGIALLL